MYSLPEADLKELAFSVGEMTLIYQIFNFSAFFLPIVQK